MAVMYFNVKQGIQTGNVVIDAASGNISNIGNITLVGGTSANLGNAAVANYFVGNGVYLTSITGANVTGYVPNATEANTAGTVTTGAQPNITSVGTLSSLSVTGNVSANYFTGNGSTLTSITGANVTGYVPNATAANTAGSATTAGTVTTNAQPNITSVGNLSGLTVDNGSYGNVVTTQYASVFAHGAGANPYSVMQVRSSDGVSGLGMQAYTGSGTLYANSAITFALGTIRDKDVPSSLVTKAYIDSNGLSVTGTVAANYFTGTLTTASQPNITSVGSLTGLTSTGVINFLGTSNVSLGNVSNLHIDGGSPGYVLQTDGAGTLTFVSAGSTGIAGVNTEVQFNDGGSFGASGAFTFDKGTNTLSVTNYVGNGAGFTFITGSNVSGNVNSAIQSHYANTANSVAGANVTGQVGNALVAGTVYTAAQPNITSVGTLLGLSVTGNLDITGNINATGNLNYSNVNDLVVGDPLIYLGANNTGNLYDLGFVASYNDGTYEHTGLARDATDGTWKLFDGVVAEPTTVIDFANGTYAPFKSGSFESTGNILALNANLGNLTTSNYFSGNGSLLTSITGANVTGYVPNANIANTATSATSATSATTAGTVTTAAQPNITSVGTLSSLSVTGNVSAGNIKSDNLLYANGSPYVFTTSAAGSNTQVQFNDSNSFAGSAAFTFNKASNTLTATNIAGNGAALTSITGANVTGYVPLATAANTAGTVTTAAQPNITSVGTLTSLDVSGNLTAGNANVTGTLTVGSIATSGAGTGNISGADYIVANYFSGNGSLLTSITGANVSGNVSSALQSNYANTANSVAGANVTGQVGNALVAGTVYTAAQPNITSVGTLTSLSVTGNVSANYFSGNGSLLTSLTGANVTGQVGNALVAGTVYTAAQPNITSVGTLSNLSVTGTVTTGSVKLTNGLTSNRSNVSVTTNTVIDQFTPSTYRTAKYIISASGDNGYQSVETLMVHDGSSAYITIYGSVCSNVSADIIDLSSNVNGVSGNVTLYATSASPNAKVNVVVTYINT